MARVTKSPEERKSEIIDAAEVLFIEKGFEDTLVSEIVKSVGVAQGTFYYYFPSKDEVLYEILERSFKKTSEEITEIHKRTDCSLLQKLQFVLSRALYPQFECKVFQKCKLSKLSPVLHEKVDGIRLQVFIPIIHKILEEGIEQKVFDVQYPEEITEILTMGIMGYMHEHFDRFEDVHFMKRKMGALEELLEKSLGISRGSLCFTEIFSEKM